MEGVLNVYKPQGMTPLQVVEKIKEVHPEYRDEKMTYAGRLDPMAEGVLIVLVGDAVHKKETYLALDKIYEADIVFGLGTDTHDLLGMPAVYAMPDISEEVIRKEIENMIGTFQYSLPIYSSKPVGGKPLFQWAREGKLNEIAIPKREMRVYGVELLEQNIITTKQLMEDIETSIVRVVGDFRQEEIGEKWKAILVDADEQDTFRVVRIRIHCASGAYIRTLAHEMGKRLGGDAVLARLVRTSVGEFSVVDAQRLG